MFKEIMHSERANLYYLEKCRVMVKDGRLTFLTVERDIQKYNNIPVANTTAIILGSGTSITQSAARMISHAGVVYGFAGGGGTPLYSGCEIEWHTPSNEYRPPEYLQKWASFWFDDTKRLAAAKHFHALRIQNIEDSWDILYTKDNFHADDFEIQKAIKAFKLKCKSSTDSSELLSAEGNFVKNIYSYAANLKAQKNFTRDPLGLDLANKFLTQGNYLAYGLAASTLWTLGIPHSLPLLHGKTRRGGLVFDVADLIKDAVILPLAFISAKDGVSESEFKQRCLLAFSSAKSMKFMFDAIKDTADKFGATK